MSGQELPPRAAGRRARDAMMADPELVHPDHGLEEAQARLADSGTSMLPVVDGDEVVGVVSRSALANRLAPTGRGDLDGGSAASRELSVGEVMTTAVPICGPDEALESIVRVIDREARAGLLVISDEGELLGVVTREALEGEGFAFTRPEAPDAAPDMTAHAVKSAVRARGEPLGWLQSYAVRPRVRR